MRNTEQHSPTPVPNWPKVIHPVRKARAYQSSGAIDDLTMRQIETLVDAISTGYVPKLEKLSAFRFEGGAR